MFEKLKDMIDEGASMLKESVSGAPPREIKAAPDDITVEQLIREAKAYVDSIIGKDDNSR